MDTRFIAAVRTARYDSIVNVLDIRLRDLLTVNENCFFPRFDSVAFYADYSLYEVPALVFGIFEDDYITTFGLPDCKNPFVGKRHLCSIDEFIDKDMVSDKEGWDHGAGRYLERLDKIRPDEERKYKGGHYSFCVLPESLFPAFFHQIFRRGSPVLQGGEKAPAPFLILFLL